MEPDRFRPLASAHGPFASVYFDDSHDTEDAAAQLGVRWKDIADQLAKLGADADLTTRVQQAAIDEPPAVGRRGRAVIAGEDIVLSEYLSHPPESIVVRVSELPYLVPIVADGMVSPPHLVVVVDHAGADITVHHDGQVRTEIVSGGDHPIHKASGAETPGYGDPQPRAEEAARRNIRLAADRVAQLVDETAPEVLFVAGEVRSRNDFLDALPKRAAQRAVEVSGGARHGGGDDVALHEQISAIFENRRNATADEVSQRFQAELGRGSGLATEGLDGVCAALREGAVETLLIGDLGDATVLRGDNHETIAPNANVLSELGAAPASTVRADEALPLAAVAIDSDLVLIGDRVDPRDGVGAVLRYAPRTAASS
jgi:peptide chain release factor subunit 1